ncbi:MAG TPA: porin [Novimethylophilus sp.]|jgi:phosphate-selective porin OprO/OprP|uniref:OprO/OprP family phosphate-selective porin n=1 Tax=Novimethylophilus sp. TaxID=2137426 RepID=UPI002F403CA2
MIPLIKKQLLFAVAAALVLPTLSLADDSVTDANARMQQLEKMMQQMQQQRAEQDQQLQALSKELMAVQDQLAQAREGKMAEKGKSTGNPVFAAFKDGLAFEDSTGNWKLQINGRIQADYRTYDPTEWKNDTFSIRRGRFGGTFSFLKDFAVRVEGEYANDNTGAKGTTALTYGYLDYTHWSGAKIRAGQFKPFFGLERTTSTNFTDFTELSIATNNGSIFTSTYDRGIMVYGDPAPWLNYNAYVVNGTGQNNDDVNDSKDIGGRINANFANLADIKNAVIHVGASASTGNIGFSTSAGNSISQVTEANGATFFSVTALGGHNRADRTRWGLETALAYGPVKFQTEYIDANFEGKRVGTALLTPNNTTIFDNDIKVWYADLNWLVSGESWSDSYKSGVFGRIRPKHNFGDKDGWGAVELGIRYSKFDASDFKALLPVATASTALTSEADAWTAGAKWILNPNARIVLNYTHTRFDTPITINGKVDDNEDALVLRAQYDF